MAFTGKMFRCRVLDTQILDSRKCLSYTVLRFCSNESPKEVKFEMLSVRPNKPKERKRAVKENKANPPRTEKMSIRQDWTNVWPAPRSFHPATVPLPLRQGKPDDTPPLGKFSNLELMKIPNFLHLTPRAIKKHCNALKKFCTKWPEELKNSSDTEKYFPIEIISSDYCHSGPVIRNPLSRIITLKFKLKCLKFDSHALDKFMRLVGARYCPQTGYVTITTDSCPLKKQNYDYAHYLLTALYFESWKFEEWEKTKSDKDMETYEFKERKSYQNVKNIFAYNNQKEPKELAGVQRAVETWQEKGDNPKSIKIYKTEVSKLLGLPLLQKEQAAAN